MPSLRRTLSSPAVRSSPYSHPSSSSSTRLGGNPSRRSSGSEVSRRRVLADIDWWLVQDGQYDPSPYVAPEGSENVEETDSDLPIVGQTTLPATTDLSPFNWLPGSGEGAFETELSAYPLGAQFDHSGAVEPSEPLSPLSQFAALTITPRNRRLTVSSDSSFSSLEASPEPAPVTLSPTLDLGLGFSDVAPPPPTTTPYATLSRSSRRPVPMSTRSVSYSFFETTRANERLQETFEDMPSESFARTMTDMDDLFF